MSGDLVGMGLVDNLAHPGGNVTGLTLLSQGLTAKRLSLLKEMDPRVQRVAVLFNPDNPNSKFQLTEAQTSASEVRLQVQPVPLRRNDDIGRVLRALPRSETALLVTDDLLLEGLRSKIATIASASRLPTRCGYRLPNDNNCLMWYGPDFLAMFRRAGNYAARILHKEKTGDIPAEQPTKFALVISAKTATAIGISVPNSLQVAADEVIR
jgi:putative ABC transport system substrate-binding protein